MPYSAADDAASEQKDLLAKDSRPLQRQKCLAAPENSYHCSGPDNKAGSTVMRGRRFGLTILFFLFATLLIGVDEARSQAAQLTLCNQSNASASVAVARKAGIYDDRFIVTGWYNVNPGYCTGTNVI